MNKLTNCLRFHYPRRKFQTHFIYSSSIGFSNHLQTRNLTFSKYKRLNPTQKKTTETIRIGCGSGFWGDTPTGVAQLLNHGNVDFLVLDYLSEVTMSLLVAAQAKNKNLGWCPDFVETVGPLLVKIKNEGIKVITNAGGINSEACMEAMLAVAKSLGVDIKIAVVLGDDLSRFKGHLGVEGYSEEAKITSVNAYLGAGPIARALHMGADIVICGRCADSSMALAPCMYEFQWSWDDFDSIATGTLAGHLIECGPQSTGGIYTDWDTVHGWENNGFPIAVCDKNGKEIIITKPDNTGGKVTFGTVVEQLLYEIHDPSHYIVPDCICDFTQVRMLERPDGSVAVSQAKGVGLTPFFKVGGTISDLWKCTAVCPIIGPRAVQKGEKTATAILARCRRIFQQMRFQDFTRVHLQVLGSEQAYGEHARKANLETRDAVMWMAVEHNDKKALEIFSREIASAGTGMAPGLTAVIGGRPKVQPVIRFFSNLYPKQDYLIHIKLSDGYVEEFVPDVKVTATLREDYIKRNIARFPIQQFPRGLFKNFFPMQDALTYIHGKRESVTPSSPIQDEELLTPTEPSYSYKLSDLAWTRSGDKGDTCNIGVIAKDKASYPILLESLTAEKVASYFEHKFTAGKARSCKRYELPGVHALNFVLENSLGGGGIASLTPDPQGKGYGQMLLDLDIVKNKTD